MSITSSNNQEQNPEFADLLAHHPGMVDWLSPVLSSGEEQQIADLWPRFLAECTEQGIPASSYPFTAKEQGQADFQTYLKKAREEIQAFYAPSQSGEQVEQVDFPPLNECAFVSKTPEMPLADTAPITEEISVLQEQAAHIAERSHSEETVLSPGEETPVAPACQKEEEQERGTEAEEQDIAQLETAHIPAVENSSAEEVGEPEPEKRGAHPEAVREPSVVSTPEASTPAQTEKQEQTALVAPSGPRALSPARQRSRRQRRPRTRRQRIISWIVLSVVLAAVLVPAISLVNFGVSAYSTYHRLSDQAHSAVNHLLDVKTTFSAPSGDKSHLNGLLDNARLRRAEQDFIASGHEFKQLQMQLKQSSTLRTITTYLPQYRDTLTSAQAASQIGIDIAAIGQIAARHVSQLAPTFSGSILAATGKPLVTQQLLDTLGITIDQITPLLKDIEAQSQKVSLDALPISAVQKTQIGQSLQLLPQVLADLDIAHGLLDKAGWLLGVKQPRTFLVQTMDRAELRGAGGFTGQYGELTINGGRIAPFSLKDISLVEYTNTSVTQGQIAPQQYRDWWPFANWGLRDSNVSANFPTTAQMAIDLYKQETNSQVDGVISFTPIVIEHVLAVIGPIQVPGYNATVNAQNLEDILHFYQLDNNGILKQILSQPNDNDTSQRKRFTSYLTSLVMDKVRSAPAEQLVEIAHQVLTDLKSKDLQMYFTDPGTEEVLTHYGYAGTLDRSTTHDGFYVVQQNLSASKASQYVKTIMHDTVTLDSKGGATHQLQIRLVYNQAGPVYGYDTYYDYMRVYVPPSSRMLYADGFSSGTPLCGGGYGSCPIDGPYPGGELVCPAGQYQPGASPPTLAQPDGGTWLPLQTLGGPTDIASDEPGRAMYGGWVIVPKNCTMNVTLSWYVPPMSAQPYSLLVQRQAGVFPELDLSILPDSGNCGKLGTTGMHYDKILTQDISFTLPAYHASKQGQSKNCYPQSGV